MSAEGRPQGEVSPVAPVLRFLARVVVQFPMPVLAIAVAAAVFSLVYTVSQLGFRTSRLDLINPESSFNQLWIEYIKEFGDSDDVLVVVEGEGRETVVPVLGEISEQIAREDRYFRAVLHEVDLSRIRQKGLHYLETKDLAAIEVFLDKVLPIVQGGWPRLEIATMAAALANRVAGAAADGSSPEAAAVELARLSDSLLDALGPRNRYRSPWPEMPSLVSTVSELTSEYFLTNQGRMGFVLLRLADGNEESFAKGSEAIQRLRDLIAQARLRHPDTRIGLTGLPVMENDEMRISQQAMLKASLLSLFGVACLFVAGFGGLRHPLMTVASLLLAMGWSFGYITLAVGHLNILSISFGVILIGLGIDFGVHYVAKYLQLRRHVRSVGQALTETSGSVGPGIVTGAVTTAIAFFMAGVTEFTGIAELGLIAGGGILLCCVAALVVLPAMIRIADAQRPGQMLPEPLDIHAWLRPLFARPLLLSAVTLAGTAAVAVGMKDLWYDYNLLNLQAEGVESVELEKRLLAESDQSVWFALSIAESREELLARKEQFLKLPSVQSVREIASLFPVESEEKLQMIRRIRARLANLPERPPQIAPGPPEELGRQLARAQMLMAGRPGWARIGYQLEQIRDLLRGMPLEECYRRLVVYQHRMAGDLLSRLHTLRSIANPEPPQLSDLPESLVTRFVGQDGKKFLLQIYSRANIWDMDAMEQFVRQIRSVDPRATGNPLQTYEASRQMLRSYEQAAWYALAAILLVLYIDFRSLRLTFLAMVPLGIGMLQMFGILGLLNIPLNPANIIVLPLILGIGVDDGVHVVHDFRRQRGRYRLSAPTANAVLITSLTTMVGFGSLMIASHRGVQSLGRVLTIGVSCCLFTSLVMLPAFLTWLSRRRTESDPDPEAGPKPKILGERRRREDAGHHPGTSPRAAPHASGAERAEAERR